MSEDERRTYEKRIYYELKENREGSQAKDGSIQFYVIAADWIEAWKTFVLNTKSMPHGINNSLLKKTIEKRRKEQGNPLTDDDIGLNK